MKKALLPLLKLSLTLGLVFYIFSTIHPALILHEVRKIPLQHAIAYFVVFSLLGPIQGIRWQVILNALGSSMPAAISQAIVCINILCISTLPSSVTAEAIRVYQAKKYHVPLINASASILIERGLALVALLFISTLTMTIGFNDYQLANKLLIVSLQIAALCLLILLFIYRNYMWHKLQQHIAMTKFSTLVEPLLQVFSQRRRNIVLFNSSLVVHVAVIIVFYCLAQDIGASLSWQNAACVFPFIILANALPFSIGGWGLREGAAVYILGLQGLNAHQAIAIASSFGVILTLSSLLLGAVGLLLLVINQRLNFRPQIMRG